MIPYIHSIINLKSFQICKEFCHFLNMKWGKMDMDLNLLQTFPSLHDYLNWIDIWFPEKRKQVISELEEMGIYYYDFPVPTDVYVSHIMVHFYWKMVRYRRSRRNLRSQFLHKLDDDWN